MPAPFTIVTLTDDDDDEFPVRLPAIYKENRGADIEAALHIANTELIPRHNWNPTGSLKFERIEYYGEG
jgi:hypothetical protein